MISNDNMIRYIIELLMQNNRVIVPNFGAFIISQGTNNKVLFNNFLSFNDGLLVGHICKEKSIDKADALIKVNLFVESIRGSLESKGECILPGLGTFTKDHHNVLRFLQALDLKLTPSTQQPERDRKTTRTAKDLLDIDLNNVPSEPLAPVTPVIESAPIDETKEVLLTIDTDNGLSTQTTAIEIDEDANFDKAVKDEPVQRTSSLQNTTISTPDTSPTYAGRNYASSRSTKQQPEKKKKSLALFLLLFILIPALLVTLYIGVYQDKFNVLHYFKPATVQQPAEKPEPVIVNEPVTVETPAPQAEPTEFQSNSRYHIIVATINTRQNADNYAKKLVEKGFEHAVVIPRYGRYLVSIDCGNDIVETEAIQENIVNKYRIESYILTLK